MAAIIHFSANTRNIANWYLF